LVAARREVALVTSGAIVAGSARLGLSRGPRSIPEKQAAAAVGQSSLMWHYEQAFKRHGIKVGQVLLTGQDISDRGRYLNARNTLLAPLAFVVLPIVNENDTLAVEEIKAGDNDNLAALVSPARASPGRRAPVARARRASHGRGHGCRARAEGVSGEGRGAPPPGRGQRRRRFRRARSARTRRGGRCDGRALPGELDSGRAAN